MKNINNPPVGKRGLLPGEAMDYGCDDCPKCQDNWCKVWEVKVDDPHGSSCESGYYFILQARHD